jgi:hypothetical protein
VLRLRRVLRVLRLLVARGAHDSTVGRPKRRVHDPRSGGTEQTNAH